MEIPLRLQPLPRGASYVRPRITSKPLPNFSPQQGDIIIREIPHRSPTRLNLDGKFEVHTDGVDNIEAVNIRNKVNTIFSSGDLILRHGGFSANFKWEFATQATLYLLWEESYEQFGRWYKVADRLDPVNNRGVVKPEWAGLLDRGASFGLNLYKGDYIITQQTSDDLPWARNFILNIVPSTYDARTSGRDFGPGDVLIRTMVTETPGNALERSITVEAHGTFNMGNFLDWRSMGRQDIIFQQVAPGHASSSRARAQGPMRPGDILFNSEEELHGATTSGTWMGGHILILPDSGSPPHQPENLPHTMLLRLGTIETEPPEYWDRSKQFWRWIDSAMQLYIQDVEPGSWSRNPIIVEGRCPGGIFPICNSEFESSSQIRDRPIRVGSRANIEPTETDIIYRFTSPREGTNIPSKRNDMDEELWKMLVRSDNPDRHHLVFFWQPTMTLQPADHLIRFGSQPAESGQGQWALSVELYKCAMTGPGRHCDWRLRGRDVVIFPSSSRSRNEQR